MSFENVFGGDNGEDKGKELFNMEKDLGPISGLSEEQKKKAEEILEEKGSTLELEDE